MTDTEVKQILDSLYPLTGIVQNDALNTIKREACRAFWKKAQDKVDEEKTKALKDASKGIENDAKIKELQEQLSILEKIRSHLAGEVEKYKAMADPEKVQRIIANRISAALAEQKATAETGESNPFMKETIKRLIANERMRTTMNLQNKTMDPQILTKDVVIMFSKSYAPVIVYQRDGRSTFLSWKNLYTSCFVSGSFNNEPWTHYTIVPNCKLEDLIGKEECQGCKHRVTDPENPNICQLPACIKDVEREKAGNRE